MKIEDLVHRLQDYELALLVSLIAGEHCIITAEADQLDQLEDAIEQSALSLFGFQDSTVTVRCDGASLDDVVESMLVDDYDTKDNYGRKRKASTASASTVRRHSLHQPSEPRRKLANIVICRDLDMAANPVQIQVLELIRTKRIFSRTSVYSSPENFLIIALLERKPASISKLNHHLLDYFFFCHKHEEEEQDDGDSNSYTSESMSSVVIRKPQGGSGGQVLVPPKLLKEFSTKAKAIQMTAEMKRYMSDVIVFLRMHRALAGGVSALATKYLELMVKCLCPLHGQDFVTPSLVSLAVYKIYSHRIRICTPDQDRSVMWGSDKAMVGQLLDQLTPDLIIDSVLSEVTPPH